MLTLSPMTVAPVCHVGDPLQLTCTTSAEFLKWSIFQSNGYRAQSLEEIINAVHINARDDNQMTDRSVNSAMFNFVRSSAREASPLISTLLINPVSIDLNGTVVYCADLSNTTSSSTLQISNSM